MKLSRHTFLATFVALTAVACLEDDIAAPDPERPLEPAGGAGRHTGGAGFSFIGDSGLFELSDAAGARPGQHAAGGSGGASSSAGGGGAGAGTTDAGTPEPKPALAGKLAINEFLPNEPGAENTAKLSFVELLGTPGLELDGGTLELVNGADGSVYDTIALGGECDERGLFVIGEADVPTADQVVPMNLQNGPDSLRLLDRDGTLIDAVGYGEFATEHVFVGMGRPAPLPPDGSSLGRVDAAGDNALDYCGMAPTPGTENEACALLDAGAD